MEDFYPFITESTILWAWTNNTICDELFWTFCRGLRITVICRTSHVLMSQLSHFGGHLTIPKMQARLHREWDFKTVMDGQSNLTVRNDQEVSIVVPLDCFFKYYSWSHSSRDFLMMKTMRSFRVWTNLTFASCHLPIDTFHDTRPLKMLHLIGIHNQSLFAIHHWGFTGFGPANSFN